MKYLDSFLNSITMYRLVMYGLGVLALIAVILGFAGMLAFSGVSLLSSLVLLVLLCYTVNVICAKLYQAPLNGESPVITALILFFILDPSFSLIGYSWIIAAGFIAIISKYVFAYRRKHFYNPAALAAFVLSVAGSGMALWWVATSILIIPTAILGLLIVRKIRRFYMFAIFVVVAVLVAVAYSFIGHYDTLTILKQYALSWPIIFFGTIMLTEPSTTPPTRGLRIVYATIVGAFFSAQFSFGNVYASPQLALLIGNSFAYIVGPKEKFLLVLSSIINMGSGFYEFVFKHAQPFQFRPGQYMEWTVAPEGSDGRGNRRYFSVSSAPGINEVRFATRMPREKVSSFKKKLLEMKPGDTIAAGALAGDFTLPADLQQPSVFIAGGIGVTPFISMLRDMKNSGIRRDIVLLYAANAESDFMFKDVLGESQASGVRVIYVAGSLITEDQIKKEVPDYSKREFYISGPNAMVDTYKAMLLHMKIGRRSIKTDYFPGL